MYSYTAFENHKILARGPLKEVAFALRRRRQKDPGAPVLIFSDLSGKQMDMDWSGSEKELEERLKVFQPIPAPAHNGPGRPKLGVVPREISLLPQHWEWLSTQPGGASSTVRRLIDEKTKAASNPKQIQETTYNVLTALAGDLPNFEEAIRFLYRKDEKKFRERMKDWPEDVVDYALELSRGVF